jgi:tetratricopeptide (TPR) repeat protein
MTTDLMKPENVYALVVGIEKYKAGVEYDLNGPANDALKFADWLLERKVKPENIQLFLSPLDKNAGLLENAITRGFTPESATHDKIAQYIRSQLTRENSRGDLLYVFWGGHGIVTTTDATVRRLFFADTDDDSKWNLDFNSLVESLSTAAYGAGFSQQIFFIDACANLFYQGQAQTIQGEVAGVEFAASGQVERSEQFVLFAAPVYEVATNSTDEGTGHFSKAVLEKLQEQPLFPQMKALAEQIQSDFLNNRKILPAYLIKLGDNQIERASSNPVKTFQLSRAQQIERSKFKLICERLGIELEDCISISQSSVSFLEDHRKSLETPNLLSTDIDQILKVASSISQSPPLTISSANLISDPPILEKWQGRAKEIQILENWLVNNDVKTIGIQGLSGIGKSWLASYIYNKSIGKSEFNAFFWADMSQMPDFILFIQNALIRLDHKTVDKLVYLQDPSQLINEFLKCLKLKKCLIVIDNLETLLDSSRSFIGSYKDFFRSWNERGNTTSKLILTTQVYPLIMEDLSCWLNLQGLDSHNGATLLKELGIQGEMSGLKEFAEIMGGHPKILRLVASLLIRYKPKPHIKDVEEFRLKYIEEILGRLNMSYREKERVIFVSILESHFFSLAKTIQVFLMNLTIYRTRSFNWQAAAVILAEGEKTSSFWEVQEALSEIIGRSLLDKVENKDEYQFQFHPFVWQYLKQKAGILPEGLRDKVITYYQSMTSDDRNTWKTLGNIVPYLEIFYHRCEQNQYKMAFDTLLICDSFLELHGYNSIRIELYKLLERSWKPLEIERKKFTDVLVRLGSAYYFTGQMYLSVAICQKALSIGVELQDRQLESRALGWMGGSYRALGEYPKALTLHQQAVKLANEVGDHDWEAACFINIGNDCYFVKDRKKQLEAYDNALKIAEKYSFRRWEAYALGGLGLTYQALGEYQKAIGYRNRALDISREVKDRREEGYSLWGLGNAYYSNGDLRQAIDYHQKALEVMQSINDLRGILLNLDRLSKLCDLSSQSQELINYCNMIIEIQEEINNPEAVAAILSLNTFD